MIVGLGNPGDEYANTRHNLGFMVVDRIAEKAGASWARAKEKARISETSVKSKPVTLVKPMTYMNLSGKAVLPLLRRLALDPARIIVVHDDMDLEDGRIRIKQGGGDGGHKGVRSIADSLRLREFIRLRIGVGRPPGRVSPEDFVLAPYEPHEQERLREIIDASVEAVELVVSKGVTKAQNFFHCK